MPRAGQRQRLPVEPGSVRLPQREARKGAVVASELTGRRRRRPGLQSHAVLRLQPGLEQQVPGRQQVLGRARQQVLGRVAPAGEACQPYLTFPFQM